MTNIYLNHYAQHGKGFNDIGPIFYSRNVVQRGRGFGGFFRSLYRYVRPLLSAGWKTLRTEGLRAGSDVLADFAAGTRPAKDILMDRGKQTLYKVAENIKNTYQQGKGLLSSCTKKMPKNKSKKYKKVKKVLNHRQSILGLTTKQIKKQSKKRVKNNKIKDIFSL